MHDITIIDGYKVCNGTYYNVNTPDTVINQLENARLNRYRIRLFYGDINTGRDWLEVYNTIGYIGRSTGKIKIPILIYNSRSLGGGAILDHCIIKITVDRETVYKNKNYQTPEFYIEESTLNNKPWFHLYRKGENVPYFGNAKRENCVNEIAFFLGKTNKHIYK